MERKRFKKWWRLPASMAIGKQAGKAVVVLGVLLAVIFFAGVANSQQYCTNWIHPPSSQQGAYFGASVATGDVNGDGKADIIVGAYGAAAGATSNAGQVYVYDGLTGLRLYTLSDPSPQIGAGFGFSVAAADVNGDGKADIIVGSPYKDVSGRQDQGQVFVFSGANASLLRTLSDPAPEASELFGFSVAAGNTSGSSNFVIVEAPYKDVSGTANQDQVFVFNTATMAVATLNYPGNPGGSSLAVRWRPATSMATVRPMSLSGLSWLTLVLVPISHMSSMGLT